MCLVLPPYTSFENCTQSSQLTQPPYLLLALTPFAIMCSFLATPHSVVRSERHQQEGTSTNRNINGCVHHTRQTLETTNKQTCAYAPLDAQHTHAHTHMTNLAGKQHFLSLPTSMDTVSSWFTACAL